jgi:signal peptidase II
MARPSSKWLVLCAILLAGLTADQTSKYLAATRLTTALDHAGPDLGSRIGEFYRARHLEAFATEPFTVWAPMWRMRYAENPGAAWGLFRGVSEGSRTLFFGVISIAAAAFILIYLRRVQPEQRLLQAGLSLVLAGALGNLTDRLARGYVIDFIDWFWWNRPDLYWPTFNVADSMIVVGVAILLLHPGPQKVAAQTRE